MLSRALATISAYALHSYSMPEAIPPRSIKHLFSDHNKVFYFYTPSLPFTFVIQARFARQVQELTKRLSNILRDTSKVNELRATGDVEMTQDLYRFVFFFPFKFHF